MKANASRSLLGAVLCSGGLLLSMPDSRAEVLTAPPAQQASSQQVTANPVPPPVGTPRQQVWKAASEYERIRLAEDIGEAGAESYARSRGLMPLLLKMQKGVIQCPDQIWVDAQNRIYVLEAKGGGSALGKGYGYIQGTPEHAIAGAKELLSRTGTSAEGKVAAARVLNAASRGKMTVWVVRTLHVQGEPSAPVLEKEAACSQAARELALAAASEMGVAETSLAKLIAAGGKVIVRVGGFAGIVGGAAQLTNGITQIKDGNPVEGGCNAGGGAGNIAAGTMIVLGKVAEGGALGAAVDGGKDVCLGIMRHNGEQIVTGTIKMAAGGAMRTGKPVLVAIGGVTYTGVLIYEHRAEIEAGSEDAVNWAHLQFDRAWNGTAYIAQKAGGVVGNAKDAVWNSGAAMTQNVGSSLATAKDATWNAGVSAADKVGELAHSAKDGAWNSGVYLIQKVRSH
jgi:hypothetical protein